MEGIKRPSMYEDLILFGVDIPMLLSIKREKVSILMPLEEKLNNVIFIRQKLLEKDLKRLGQTHKMAEYWTYIYSLTDYKLKLRIATLRADIKRIEKQVRYLEIKEAGLEILDVEGAKRVPISEVYIGKLRKTNKNEIGLCPFHNEKTGSFVINVRKNTYCCYGCNAHGDVIDFFMKVHRLTFKEAVQALV